MQNKYIEKYLATYLYIYLPTYIPPPQARRGGKPEPSYHHHRPQGRTRRFIPPSQAIRVGTIGREEELRNPGLYILLNIYYYIFIKNIFIYLNKFYIRISKSIPLLIIIIIYFII